MTNCEDTLIGLDDLSKLAQEFECEKFTLCDFTKHYDKLFHGFRDKEFNLFEIGILKGASMRMWEAYFHKAQIYAIDTYVRATLQSSDRVHCTLMNQCEKVRLRELAEYVGKFFIICDDGSHEAPDMIDSMEVLYPFLEEGGYYIVEDILPETKQPVYDFITTLPHKIVCKEVSRYRPEIDMVILQKCTKT
jgi:hypothetical protein